MLVAHRQQVRVRLDNQVLLLLLVVGEIAGFGGLGAASTAAWTADGLDLGDLLLILVGLERAVHTRLVANQLVCLIRS